jgi:hypothetical protein
MSQPLSTAAPRAREKVSEKGIFFPVTVRLKSKIDQFTHFLYSLNPNNWFNDLRDIEISMKEFSSEQDHTTPAQKDTR